MFKGSEHKILLVLDDLEITDDIKLSLATDPDDSNNPVCRNGTVLEGLVGAHLRVHLSVPTR